MLNFFNPFAQFTDSNGNPLSAGRVDFFEAGTDNPKNAFSDYAKANPISTIALDAGGFPQSQIFFGTGLYKIKVYQNTNGVYSLFKISDNILGDGLGVTVDPTNKKVRFVEDASSLTTLDAVTLGIDYAYCYNYNGEPLGGGWFKWDSSSSATEDLGFYFKYNSNALGRWIRIYDKEEIIPQLWGVNCANSLQIHNGGLSKAIAYAYANSRRLSLPSSGSGYYYLNSNLDFTNCPTLRIEHGARFHYNSTGTISVLAPCPTVIEGAKAIFNDNAKFAGSLLNAKYIRPEHFGAVGDNSTDCYYAFSYGATYVSTPTFILGDGKTYKVLATGALSVSVSFCNIKSEGGVINLASSTSGENWFVVLDCESTNLGLPIFSGAFNHLYFEKKTAKTSFFSVGFAPTATQLQNIWNSITASGTVTGTLVWDHPWTVPAINVPLANFVKNEFTRGLVTFNGSAFLGEFDRKDGIFTQNSNYPILKDNAEIYPFWWGRSVAGITKALTCNSLNNGSYLDFRGEYFQGSVLIPNSGVFKIRNVNLAEPSNGAGALKNTTSGAQSFALEIESGKIAGNVALHTTSNIDLKSVDISPFGMSTDNFIKAGSGLIWRSSVASPCTEFYGGFIFDSCYFGAELSLYNGSGARLTKNTINGNLYLTASASAYVFSNLIVKDNILSAINLGTNIATFGHKAEVYDNCTSLGGSVNSTRITFDWVTDSQGADVYNGYTFSTGTSHKPALLAGRFLPFAQEPINCVVTVINVPTGDSIDLIKNLKAVYGIKDGNYMIVVYNGDSVANTAKLRLNVTWTNLKGGL